MRIGDLLNPIGLVAALATSVSTPAAAVGRMLGLQPTDGRAMLVKQFVVQGGVTITGVQFSSNDPSTSFPEVSLVQGPLDRLSGGQVVARELDVEGTSGAVVIVQWPAPVQVASEGVYYVAIRFPAGIGRQGPGLGAAIGANDVPGPQGSFLAGDGDAVLMRVRADLDVTLLTSSGGSAAPGGPYKAGDLPVEQAAPRTYLRAPSILAGSGSEIEYGVRRATPVELGLYDVAGRQVHSLARGVVSGGTYHASWNGRNDRGDDVPCGVYLIRLKTQEKTVTGKIIVIR